MTAILIDTGDPEADPAGDIDIGNDTVTGAGTEAVIATDIDVDETGGVTGRGSCKA